MASGVNINLKIPGNALDGLKGAAIDKAVAASVRRAGDIAARALLTETADYVKTRKNLKVGYIREQMSLKRPGMSTKLGDMKWQLRIKGPPVSLKQYPFTVTWKQGTARVTSKGFSFRENKRAPRFMGVSVRVNTGKGATKLARAFVATGGHIFQREKGAKRLPIHKMWSSRLTDVAQDTGFIQRAVDRSNKRLETEFNRIIDLELGKLRK